MADAFTKTSLVLGAAAGVMALGSVVTYQSMLSPEARKGIAITYSKIVFPTMVFKGIAAIDIHALDANMALIILLSKACVVIAMFTFGMLVFSKTKSKSAYAHAAAFAMASTHSFDVGFGVPLATVLFPKMVQYVFLNQTIQLVFINPILIVCIELGLGVDEKGSSTISAVRSGLVQTALNPVFFMTVFGVIASEYFRTESGAGELPPILNAICNQITSAGPFLGMFLLGFAMNDLVNTSKQDFGSTAVLTCAKCLVMPLIYVTIPTILNMEETLSLIPFLAFLGGLPATASVYSMCLTRQLSPFVIGPLIPASMLVAAFFVLLPMWPSIQFIESPLRIGVCLSAVIGGTVALNSSRTQNRVKRSNKNE
jgi:hypothetical protein